MAFVFPPSLLPGLDKFTFCNLASPGQFIATEDDDHATTIIVVVIPLANPLLSHTKSHRIARQQTRAADQLLKWLLCCLA